MYKRNTFKALMSLIGDDSTHYLVGVSSWASPNLSAFSNAFMKIQRKGVLNSLNISMNFKHFH